MIKNKVNVIKIYEDPYNVKVKGLTPEIVRRTLKAHFLAYFNLWYNDNSPQIDTLNNFVMYHASLGSQVSIKVNTFEATVDVNKMLTQRFITQNLGHYKSHEPSRDIGIHDHRLVSRLLIYSRTLVALETDQVT